MTHALEVVVDVKKIISSPLNQPFLCNISTLNFINFTHVWIEKLFLLKLTFVYIVEEVKSWHNSSILYKVRRIVCFWLLWISEMFLKIQFHLFIIVGVEMDKFYLTQTTSLEKLFHRYLHDLSYHKPVYLQQIKFLKSMIFIVVICHLHFDIDGITYDQLLQSVKLSSSFWQNMLPK